MNILLIGGGGFIGSGLSNFFKETGHTISIIDQHPRMVKRHYSLLQLGWDRIIKELQKDKSWIIIDLAYASVPGTSFVDPIKDFTDNLYLINKNLEAVNQLDVSKYIYISSGGTVYGNPSKDLIDEETQNFPLSPYGITKMACERYVNLYRELYGLNTIILRPSNVYGPGQIPFRGQGLISTALGLAYKNEPIKIFGHGTAIRDYIFIDDFCKAVSDIINHAPSGEIYNVSAGLGSNINDIVALLNNVITQDGYILLTEQLPERPFDVKSNVLDNTKLRMLNNWIPTTDLEEGIKQTWQWIKTYLKTPH